MKIRLRTRKFKLLEVKVLCPISSNPDRTGYAGTYAAFANTCPAKRAEVAEKYAPAATRPTNVSRAETTPPQQAGAPARISRQGGGLFR